MRYDVVVAGGSIAGLLCAREAAAGGASVLVLERGEVGLPEHCGGLVSLAGLGRLGAPTKGMQLHRIERGIIEPPGGRAVSIGARGQGIVALRRGELDSRIAAQARDAGAEVAEGVTCYGRDGRTVRSGLGETECRVFVDARGAAALIQGDRSGIIPSAQCVASGGAIEDGTVRVHMDQGRYPGFFAWVIPLGGGSGKVGVAGRGIDARAALVEFLRKVGAGGAHGTVFAPVWVGGPVKSFVKGGAVTVGDAAGQSKPTTAGGIYSCGMGGVLAGRAIARYLKGGDARDLKRYESGWRGEFGKEFSGQLLARKALEGMGNAGIDRLLGAITPETAAELSRNGDFDFHLGAIARMLGAGGVARVAAALAIGQLASVLGGRAGSHKV